jgi:hypothetical protein
MQVFYFSITVGAGLCVMDWAQKRALHNLAGESKVSIVWFPCVAALVLGPETMLI